MASKIKGPEWKLVYIVTAIIDALQFLIGFTGVGIVINEVADPIIGGVLVAYFQLRGVNMITKPARLASLFGVAGVEALTGGFAPAWVIDIWYIKKTVMAEEAQETQARAEIEKFSNETRAPLYQNGMRMPTQEQEKEIGPTNIDGVRKPGRATSIIKPDQNFGK